MSQKQNRMTALFLICIFLKNLKILLRASTIEGKVVE